MAKKTVTIIRGDSYEWPVTFTESDGTAIDLTGGTVFFTVNESDAPTDDTGAAIAVETTSHTDATAGESLITLSASDTDITPGNYFFDIQFVGAGGEVVSKPQAKLKVIGDISRRVA